jgi:hypothetical protein
VYNILNFKNVSDHKIILFLGYFLRYFCPELIMCCAYEYNYIKY